MITRFQSEAAPWGGAVKLSLQAPEGTSVLIVATAGSGAPTPDALPEEARIVHDGPLAMPTSDWSLTHFDLPGKTTWWQVNDLATGNLPDNVTVHYHAFEHDGIAFAAPLSVSATPNCLRTSTRALARDAVRARLEYHLTRGLRENLIPPVDQGWIPVREREALADGDPVPIVLIKERVMPLLAAETIGHLRAGTTSDGRARQWIRHVRSVVDILLIAETPALRTSIGTYIENVLNQDEPYWEHAGLQTITVQNVDRHEATDRDYFLAEITFECEGELVIREELRVTVADELDIIGCGCGGDGE